MLRTSVAGTERISSVRLGWEPATQAPQPGLFLLTRVTGSGPPSYPLISLQKLTDSIEGGGDPDVDRVTS